LKENGTGGVDLCSLVVNYVAVKKNADQVQNNSPKTHNCWMLVSSGASLQTKYIDQFIFALA
jgi:hypothetical protein